MSRRSVFSRILSVFLVFALAVACVPIGKGKTAQGAAIWIGIEDQLDPVEIKLTHKVTEQVITWIPSLGIWLTQDNAFQIDATFENTNSTAIENAKVYLNLPDELVYKPRSTHVAGSYVVQNIIDDGPSWGRDESTELELGNIDPRKNQTVLWDVEIADMDSLYQDRNLEYSVTITADNMPSITAYAVIFVNGYNQNNNILDFSKDTWRFINYNETPIPILSEDLRALKYGQKNSEKTMFDEIVAGGAKGYCAGMAITAVLAKVNRLDLESIQNGVINLHELGKTEKSKSLIAFYYLTQFFDPYQTNKVEFQRLSTRDKLARIAELADAVDSGANPFVLMFLTDRGGHAVTAYSFERKNFSKGGKNYDARVLIYDNNSPSWSEDHCLYFNEGTGEWTIPAYNAKNLTGAFYDINQIDQTSLSSNKKNVRAVIRARNNTSLIIELINRIVKINQSDTNGDSDVLAIEDDVEAIDDSVVPVNIYLDDNEQPFLIKPQTDGELLDLIIKYSHFTLVAKSDSTSGASFDPSGAVSLIDNNGSFKLVISGDEGYHPLPWYEVTVNGTGINNDPQITVVDNGYILSGIEQGKIVIQGKNDDGIKELLFDKHEGDVFVSERNGELIALADTDGDGKFEKEIANSTKNQSNNYNGDSGSSDSPATQAQETVAIKDEAPPLASNPVTVRLAGNSRIDTSVAISQQGWPEKADTVVLAYAYAFPDALAAAPLAFKEKAPILLTDNESLPAATFTEIQRLSPSKVILVGGTAVLSADIENTLSQSYQVIRYAGIDSYETAAIIANAVGTAGSAIVVSGEIYQDALAISSYAASQGIPILFTQKDTLPSVTASTLRRLGVNNTIVAGGIGVVNDSVYGQLPSPVRYAGYDCYETAAAVASASALGMNLENVYIATGLDFADALVAGNLAAHTKSPLIMVDRGSSLPDATKNFFNEHKGKIKNITVVGGTVMVTEDQVNAIWNILE